LSALTKQKKVFKHVEKNAFKQAKTPI